MELKVNGLARHCKDGQTVAELLTTHALDENASGVAVAVNDAVVPRSEWKSKPLAEGDNVEIIHAVQGG